MTLTVRLPPRVEQQLAEYCASHKTTRSNAVKLAVSLLTEQTKRKPTPYSLGVDLFEADDTPAAESTSYSKERMRALVRSRIARR